MSASDLDFGLNDNFFDSSYEEKHILSNDFRIDLEDNEMLNPFFVNIYGGSVSKMDHKDIFTKYKKVYIICQKTTTYKIDIKPLLQRIIDKTKFKDIMSNMTLICVENSILKNKKHLQNAVIINKGFLLQIPNLTYEFDTIELVIPLFELQENVAQLYTKLYTYDMTPEDYIKNRIMIQYFGCDTEYKQISMKLTDMLHRSKDVQYWKNPNNCRINITEAFKNRMFRYKGIIDGVMTDFNNIKDPEAKEMINKLMLEGNNNYDIQEPQDIFCRPEFIDIASGIKSNNGYKLYRIDSPIDLNGLTKDKVTELFKLMTNEREIYDLANTLLTTKSYCHLVLFNKNVLELLKSSFNKFLPAYKLSIGYAFATLYTEECVKKTNIIETDRMVCDIETAHHLPFFPYIHSDIHQNPYLPLLVSTDSMKLDMNLHGLSMIKNYQDYGLDDFEGFQKKFNIFTTERIDKNIFDGLETEPNSKRWKSFAVGGSIIPSCSLKRHPLLDMITTSASSYTERWSRFFNEYHHESDIDVMCNKTSVYEFMDEVEKLKNVVIKNLNDLNNKDVSSRVEVEPIKTLVIIIHEKYITQCMPNYTVKEVADKIESDEIKEIFYNIYISTKASSNEKLRKTKGNNPLYQHFFRTSTISDMKLILTNYDTFKSNYNADNEFCTYWNDIPDNKKVPTEENLLLLKISEGIKFKIKSPHMQHNIEVFRTKYPEYFSCVARFHLPYVRAYCTGDNVYGLPSWISAMQTFTNIDYKYIAGSRDPIEIINKSLQKGFGVILNEKEKTHLVDYNSKVTKWQEVYGLHRNKNIAIKDIFSPKKHGDNIFKVGKFFQGFPDDIYKHTTFQYVSTIKDLYDVYKTQYNYDAEKSPIDLLKFKVINKDGYIEPLRPWLFDAAFDCLS